MTDELEKEFNDFIKKWCGSNYPHLIDSDENDGERFREKLRNVMDKKKLILFKNFINYQRKQEKDDKFAETGDLAVLYRFINNIGGWAVVFGKREGDFISKKKVEEVIDNWLCSSAEWTPEERKRLKKELGLSDKLFGMNIKVDKNLKGNQFRLEQN